MNMADRVWVIRPGALGDTLMALPALADLTGKAKIVFAGRQPGLRFIAPRVCGVEDFESAGWHRLFMSEPAGGGPKDPRAAGVIAFLGGEGGRLRGNLSVLFPGAPIFLFHSVPPAEQPMHVARHVACCLKEAGLPLDPDRCMERCAGQALIPSGDGLDAGGRVVIHPGSGDPAKNFPPCFWLRLIARLRESDQGELTEVLVLLGPAEGPSVEAFQNGLRSMGVGIRHSPEYAELRDILGGASLYVGHDSGVTHLAAMLGAPVIALFRTSRPELWGPLGPFVRVIHGCDDGCELEPRVLKTAEEMTASTRRKGTT
jgi:hypothetical protein